MSMFNRYETINREISLVNLLSRLGHEPARRSRKELIYLSMLRDNDTSPSLCVNDQLGVWYDHGLGKGGSVIDFGLSYWNTTSVKEVADRIERIFNGELAQEVSATEKKRRPRLPVKVPHYLIEDVKDIGLNPIISDYLSSRGVLHVANHLLREVYYYVEDEKKQRKHFFSAGWQNEKEGWEVRNKYFKGCLGHKDISFIPGEAGKLVLFEGFLDYLSWLRYQKEDGREIKETALILNSLSMLPVAIKKAKDYGQVDLFFDNDPSGRSHAADFLLAVPQARDRSELYAEYKDLNEKLVSDLKSREKHVTFYESFVSTDVTNSPRR